MKAITSRLTTTEKHAIASYRSMTEWLCSLSDEEYHTYLAMPFAMRLATFRGLGLGCTQDKRVNLISATSRSYRSDQVAFLRT